MHYAARLILLLSFSASGFTASIGVPEGMVSNIIYISQGKASGQFGIVANCVADKIGLDFEWSEYPTRRLFIMAQNNELDIIYPVGFSQERNEFAVASKAVYTSQDLWLYVGDQPNFMDKGLSIAVIRGSPQENSLVKMGYHNVSLVKYDAILEMLRMKRVTAVILPEKIFIGLTGSTKLYSSQVFHTRQRGFYLSRKFAKKHLATINKAIDGCLSL